MSTKIGMDDAIIQLREMFPSVEESNNAELKKLWGEI